MVPRASWPPASTRGPRNIRATPCAGRLQVVELAGLPQSFCGGTKGGRRSTAQPTETIGGERVRASWRAGCLEMMVLAAMGAPPRAGAKDAPPIRVRGTIERVEDPVYVIKTRDGTELKLTVAAKPSIATLLKASL